MFWLFFSDSTEESSSKGDKGIQLSASTPSSTSQQLIQIKSRIHCLLFKTKNVLKLLKEKEKIILNR